MTNNDKPIWVRSPRDVEKESYDEFFKSTFKDFIDEINTMKRWKAYEEEQAAERVRNIMKLKRGLNEEDLKAAVA